MAAGCGEDLVCRIECGDLDPALDTVERILNGSGLELRAGPAAPNRSYRGPLVDRDETARLRAVVCRRSGTTPASRSAAAGPPRWGAARLGRRGPGPAPALRCRRGPTRRRRLGGAGGEISRRRGPQRPARIRPSLRPRRGRPGRHRSRRDAALYRGAGRAAGPGRVRAAGPHRGLRRPRRRAAPQLPHRSRAAPAPTAGGASPPGSTAATRNWPSAPTRSCWSSTARRPRCAAPTWPTSCAPSRQPTGPKTAMS